MSIWAHVNASFRLDNWDCYSEEEINTIFGKSVLWGDDGTGNWDDYDEHPEQYLPCGSEGSLQLSVWRNPDKSHLFSNLVSVFGDLRDYDDASLIEKWFTEVCNSEDLLIRQAVCEVNIPPLVHEMYMWHGEGVEKFSLKYKI